MKKIVITSYILLSFFTVFSRISDADNSFDVPKKALEYIEQGEFEKAREELKNFQRSQPDNPFVYFYLARIEEDHNKALWLYKEAEILADSSLASEALYRRAEMVFSAGNYADARRLYDHLLDEYPASVFCLEALYRIGIISLREEKPLEAIDYFNQSVELDAGGRKRVYAMTGIMESYVALKEWNKALECAHKVLKENDDVSAFTPRVLEVIALSWQELGNDENARVFTERLLKNYPYSYQAHAIREKGNRIASDSEYSFDNGIAISGTEKTEAVVPESEVDEENAEFSVQLGAFEMRTNALKMFRNLEKAGFNVRVDMKTGQNIHYFLVRVGYFMTREEADIMVERINRISGIKGNVVILDK